MKKRLVITYPHAIYPEVNCTVMLPHEVLPDSTLQFTITQEALEDILDLIAGGSKNIKYTIE